MVTMKAVMMYLPSTKQSAPPVVKEEKAGNFKNRDLHLPQVPRMKTCRTES